MCDSVEESAGRPRLGRGEHGAWPAKGGGRPSSFENTVLFWRIGGPGSVPAVPAVSYRRLFLAVMLVVG